MTSKLTREERVQALYDLKVGQVLSLADIENVKMLASMSLAAMDSEPVELPLDYLQGHKDGLEWAAQLAEANHHETGDWLYDDPIELAKAIRKGTDMPLVPTVRDSEPVAYMYDGEDGREYNGHNEFSGGGKGIPLYRHAQQPVELANIALPHSWFDGEGVEVMSADEVKRAFRDAMLAAAPQEVKP